MSKLLFLKDPYLMETKTKLADIIDVDVKKKILVVEETIFHPQGGGQPSDVGTIQTNDNIIFKVEKATQKDGIVHHLGEFLGDSTFKINDEVQLKIDKDVRITNLKLHSAGHLIDVAIRNIGYTEWITTKGYHFPSGAYDEYNMNGQDLKTDKEEFMNILQKECDRLLNCDMEVLDQFYEYDSIEKIIGKTPDYLPKNQPVRMVTYGGKNGIICPCSGTHNVNVLFIGNSYTMNNNLPLLIMNLFKSSGQNITFKYSTALQGGKDLKYHSEQPKVKEFLESKWDFVILQDYSLTPGLPSRRNSSISVLTNFFKPRFIKTKSNVIFYNTWGRRKGLTWEPNYKTYKGMQKLLIEGYKLYDRIIKDTNFSVRHSQVGQTFEIIYDDIVRRGENPQDPKSWFFKLYHPDESHPSIHGSYLASCVFYKTIFHKSPIGLSFKPNGITEEEKLFLQKVAAV
eukprot:gene5325-9135_t